jgi:hypothetical protein
VRGRRPLILLLFAAFSVLASVAGASTLDVPLTVEESTGAALFAQYFRNSQRFLWYLSEDARTPMAEPSATR